MTDATLDALSKISSMKAFAEMYKPTHPLARNGPLRHGALQKRLADKPYNPPPLHQRRQPQRAQSASEKRSSTLSSPLASIATPATTQAATSAHAIAFEEQAFNSSSISTLLTQWLKEGQQLNAHFSTEVTAIQAEITSLQGLARSMVSKVCSDVDIAPPFEEVDNDCEGGDWKPPDTDSASASAPGSDEIHAAKVCRDRLPPDKRVIVALNSDDTQASDSDSH